MSIEETLNRIADSNDKIVALLSSAAPVATTPAAPVATTPAAPVATTPAAPVAAPPSVDASSLTLDFLNDMCVKAATKLQDGGAAVRAILSEFGAATIDTIPQANLVQFHDKVKAL